MYNELIKRTQFPYQDLSYLLVAFSISSIYLDIDNLDFKTGFILIFFSSVIGTFFGQLRLIERGLNRYFERSKGFELEPFNSPFITEEKNKLIAICYFFLATWFLIIVNPLILSIDIQIILAVLISFILAISIYNSWDIPKKLHLIEQYYKLLAEKIDLNTVKEALARKDWQEASILLEKHTRVGVALFK